MKVPENKSDSIYPTPPRSPENEDPNTYNLSHLFSTRELEDAKKLTERTIQIIDKLPQQAQNTAKRTNSLVMNRVELQESFDRFEAAVLSMPTSESCILLTESLKEHGMPKTLELLDHISNAKISKGKRFNSISPWPTSKAGQYLHLERKVGKESKAPPFPGKYGLEDVMEPPLDKVVTVGDSSYSFAELLLMDEPPKGFEKAKQEIDSYYKNKPYLEMNLPSQKMLLTVPTSRYTPNQFIAVSTPEKADILEMVHRLRLEKREALVETSEKGSKSFVGIMPPKLTTAEKQSILKEVKKSQFKQLSQISERKGTLPNNNNIRSMAELTNTLPPGSFIGQNSLDTSSDATYQHFQIFTNAPTHLIPLFNTGGESLFETENVKGEKLDSKEFPVPVYKISAKVNDKATQDLLAKIQDEFNKDHPGTSINLLTHKRLDGNTEFYFVLRKNMTIFPKLRDVFKSQNCNQPGWAEMGGMRIASNPEIFERIPDEKYKSDILSPFAPDSTEENAFRDIFVNTQ